MEFEFDLVWRRTLPGDAGAESLAEALVTEPVIVINPANAEHPAVIRDLYEP